MPPEVTRLVKERVSLFIRDVWWSATARLLPTLGASATGRRPISGLGRRWHAEPTSASLRSIGADLAQALVENLVEAGLDPFVVDAGPSHVEVGLNLEQRDQAVDALRQLPRAEGWTVRCGRGRRSCYCAASRGRSRPLRRATTWHVFRPFRRGEILAGPGQAVIVQFWDLGSSSQRELVGQRGLDRFEPTSPKTEVLALGRTLPGRHAFPLETAAERVTEPIDAVYTWVTMEDDHWRAQFAHWSRRMGRDAEEVNLASARYRDNDELRYSLRSLHDHADWVRRIWVVTAGQTPNWLVEDDRLAIIDHRDILDDAYLPTFNSHVIESALHHISGLTEHFVYLNDDMFLGRPLSPEHFFAPGGLPYLFASRGRVLAQADGSALAVDTAARNGQALLEQAVGRRATFKPLHAPYALRRSTMEELEQRFPEAFASTRRARFRSPSDLSTAANLGLYFGLATGRAVSGSIGNEYVSLGSARLTWHLDRLERSRRFDTFCINETEVTGEALTERAAVASFLERYFPIASPWEQSP